MIAIDTSVIVAIFRNESDAPAFLGAFAASESSHISAVGVMECSIVIRSLKTLSPSQAEDWLDRFLAATGVVVEPITVESLVLARAAHVRYGKGTGHPAQLNFGDCFSYALAKALGVPLLYKGEDFAKTDIVSALG